jgi:hypothetical protein
VPLSLVVVSETSRRDVIGTTNMLIEMASSQYDIDNDDDKYDDG